MEIIITENEDTIGIIKNGFIEFNKQMLGTYYHSRTIAFYIEDIGGIVCKLIKHYIFVASWFNKLRLYSSFAESGFIFFSPTNYIENIPFLGDFFNHFLAQYIDFIELFLFITGD